MDNHEEILDALTAFGKNPNTQEIPSVLEQYLNSVAKNGETIFPWSQLKPLILRKMELVILELRRNLASENIPTRPNVENVRFDVIHARIIDSLHKFNGAPFTIQRLCELLIDPKRHYKRSDKFMRGLEKNVLVVSTVDPFGRKVVSELGNKPVLNGILDINGSFPPRDSALSVPLPPVPGWVNTTAVNRSVTAGATAMPSAIVDKNGAGSDIDNLDRDSDGVVSNSLAVSGEQVFSDQGNPLAVHSEEVVEETVVTMDTGEVSSVVTDGGESLAEREIEPDIGEDRDASSFSSSSSSSEELSTSSDSIENGIRRSTSPLALSGANLNDEVTAMDENRPWAAFAQDIKPQDNLATTSSNQSAAEENQTSGVSSSSPHNTSTADTSASSSSSSVCLSSPSSASSEAQSSLLSTSTTITSKVDEHQEEKNSSPIDCVSNQQMTTTSDQPNWQQPSCEESSTADSNQSFGFDSTATSPQHSNDMTTTVTDKLISSSTSTVVPTTTSTTNNTYNTPSDIHTSSSSAGDSVVATQPPTYAQIVASSTTDKMSSSSSSIQHISPYDSATEPVPACDSVAGLERLVGSMEQSLSSSSSVICPSSSSSSSPSSSHPSSLATTSHNNSPAVTTSSLPESSLAPMGSTCQTIPSSSEEGEPLTKRIRLSVDEENMEEDCISTSGDSCMEESQPSMEEEQQQQQHKEEGHGAVHSSSVDIEGDARQQEREAPEEDAQMEEEEGQVSTATVMDDDSKECTAGLESTSAERDNATGDVDSSDVDTKGADNSNSNDESSTVSTTDNDDQKASLVDDKE